MRRRCFPAYCSPSLLNSLEPDISRSIRFFSSSSSSSFLTLSSCSSSSSCSASRASSHFAPLTRSAVVVVLFFLSVRFSCFSRAAFASMHCSSGSSTLAISLGAPLRPFFRAPPLPFLSLTSIRIFITIPISVHHRGLVNCFLFPIRRSIPRDVYYAACNPRRRAGRLV